MTLVSYRSGVQVPPTTITHIWNYAFITPKKKGNNKIYKCSYLNVASKQGVTSVAKLGGKPESKIGWLGFPQNRTRKADSHPIDPELYRLEVVRVSEGDGTGEGRVGSR